VTDPRIERGMAAQLEAMPAALGPGEAPLGWKLGFGSPTSMQRFGIDAPLVGYLAPSGRIDAGGSVAIGRWTSPIAEPEIAVFVGADVPAGSDRSGVASAIAGLGPAIELVDVHPPPEDVEAILAWNLYQRGVVLGPVDRSRPGGATEGLVGEVRVGDRTVRADDVTAMTGDPVELVRHVADVLGALGRSLEAGQVVITGSIVQPIAVRPGDHVRFGLAPVGEVDVRFVAS
jgi:2-keto-4-pentenoate hydratase